VRADHLIVRYGATLALDDVSLDFPPGRITMVVGGDGAGKTTLLRAIVGLVGVQGTVDRPPAHEIGYMPTGAGSWSDLTVDENVAFIGGAYGLRGVALQERAEALLGAAGLDGVGDRLAGHLSGGMHTKLGFCLAMLHRPRLLVLDEPSTGVDPVSRVELWRMISDAAVHGAAVLMSTTYIDEAERAGSVTVLQEGHVLLSGTPEEIVAACPGHIVATDHPQRPELAWHDGDGYREWFPEPGHGDPPTLEDVCIIASLQGSP